MRHSDSSEQGSVLLAMMAIIAIGAMAAASFSIVRQSQLTTRHDRNFVEAIQVADAGLQQALTYLRTNDPAVATFQPSDDPSLDTTAGTGSFDWTATRNGADWEVHATGTVNGVTRRVEALVTRSQELVLAAFGDKKVEVKGCGGKGVNVGSYDSQNPAGGQTTTGGKVGSNGDVNPAGCSTLHQVYTYGPGSSCDAGCAGSASNGTIHINEKIKVDEIYQGLLAEYQANCSGGNIHGVYDALIWKASGKQLEPGKTYCFDEMIMNENVAIPLLDQDNPVRVYVTGDVHPGKGKAGLKWNCPYCESTAADFTPTPCCPGPWTVEKHWSLEAAGMFITVVSDTAEVELQNQAYYGFMLSAPKAICNATGQVNVYGSLLCSELTANGGFNLYFDDNAARTGYGLFTIAEWREEVGDSTSF